MKKTLFFLIALFSFNLFSFSYNPYVEQEIWDQLKPYFLPIKHPAKEILDEIFQADRATFSRESFIAAGFEVNAPKQPGNLLVGKHPRLKGFLVKAYLDNQDAAEWDNFFKRATGALSIKKWIKDNHYKKYFDVPKKWIYPLPITPSPPPGDYFRKNFILLVEDANILNHHHNGIAFKRKITSEHLDALYRIITELGLIDSVFRGNIPFNRSSKICFIDTEHHHRWPINYNRLLRYLSPEMQLYWQSVTGCEPLEPLAEVPI